MRQVRLAAVVLILLAGPIVAVLARPAPPNPSTDCEKWVGEETQFDWVREDLGLQDAIIYGSPDEARMHVDTTEPLTPLEKLRVRASLTCRVTFRVVRHGSGELSARADQAFDFLAAAKGGSLECLFVGERPELNGIDAGAVGGVPDDLKARLRRLISPTHVVFEVMTRDDCQVPK